MQTLTYENFRRWLTVYGKASEENDAKTSADLFAQEARYYESPFDEPMIGRAAIFAYWNEGAQTLKNKISCHDILTVKDNIGIARWQSRFTVIESGKRLALDCLFVVEFDAAGLCQTFREWWHIVNIPE